MMPPPYYHQVQGTPIWDATYTTVTNGLTWQLWPVDLPSAPPAGPEPPLQRFKRRNAERQQRGQEQAARLRRRDNRYTRRLW